MRVRSPLTLNAAGRLAACIALLILVAVNVRWAYTWRPDELLDLGSFLHSAASYERGLNPYVENAGVSPQPLADAVNLNPPIVVHLFRPLTSFDPMDVDSAFFAGNLVLLATALALLAGAYPAHRRPLTLLACCAMAGVTQILAFGQIYAPLIVASGLSWLLMQRGRTAEAAICIGLIVAIKPNFVLWPLLLLLAGYPRPALTAIAAAAAISVIPLAIDGPRIYEQWLDAAAAFEGFSKGNAALRSFVPAMDVPRAVVYAASAVLVAGACAFAARYRLDARAVSAVALVTAMLVGPATWPGYILMLWPFLFSRQWTPAIWVAVILLLEPGWMQWPDAPVINQIEPVLRGVTYTWALLILLGVAVVDGLKAGLTVRPRQPTNDEAMPTTGPVLSAASGI